VVLNCVLNADWSIKFGSEVTGRLSSGGVFAAADVEQPLLQMTIPGLVREHLMGDTQDLLHFLILTFRGVGTWMVIGRWPVS
jgi:hypothetical protein